MELAAIVISLVALAVSGYVVIKLTKVQDIQQGFNDKLLQLSHDVAWQDDYVKLKKRVEKLESWQQWVETAGSELRS